MDEPPFNSMITLKIGGVKLLLFVSSFPERIFVDSSISS
jgi:hypothetical protein